MQPEWKTAFFRGIVLSTNGVWISPRFGTLKLPQPFARRIRRLMAIQALTRIDSFIKLQ